MCKSGVKTILACRNEDLGKEAAAAFHSEGFDAEFRQLDIADKESINQFVESLQKDYGKIDILVNNAAIAFKAADPTPFQQQARPTIMVNFFGTLWFTEAMLPLLRKAESPRLVNVASQSGHLRIFRSEELKQVFTSPSLTVSELDHFMNEFITAVESGTHDARGWPNTCYGMSKLGVIALTRVLAREESKMLVNACCPGYCDTDMTSHKGPRPADVGAETPTFLALLPDGGPSGRFFYDSQELEW